MPSLPFGSYEARRLALEAVVSDKTLRRAYRCPQRVREATLIRIARAAAPTPIPGVPSPSTDIAGNGDVRH